MLRESDQFAEDVIELVLNVEDPIEHIKGVIIPAMDERRGRFDLALTADQVMSRLFQKANSDKPGEAAEFFQEFTANRDGRFLHPAEAAEWADIGYYILQPNVQNNSEIQALIGFIDFVYDARELVFLLTIVKYSTRLEYGDLENYKIIELDLIEQFLQNPKIKERYPWLELPMLRS